MSKVLVKFKADWADEFDCEEFIIVEGTVKEVREKLSNKLKELAEDVEDEVYFGTNEFFTLEDLEDGSAFTFQKIGDKQAETLVKLLGTNFGTGILSEIFDGIKEEPEGNPNQLPLPVIAPHPDWPFPQAKPV